MHRQSADLLPGIAEANKVSELFELGKGCSYKGIILERPVKHLLLRRLNCFFHRHLPGIHEPLKLPQRLRPDRTLCHFVRQVQLIS